MTRRQLRYGYTTGACAAAATKGAAQMLRDQTLVDEVEIHLPIGESVRFRLHGQRLTDSGASCYVVKDAGDDPDITNGAEIHVTIGVDFFSPRGVVIKGGTGIGRITKPGLAIPPGEWAINPVPRKMIHEVMKEVMALRCVPATFTITISIPDGEERARKTLNSRLGIVGGLSILGTTGIVKPISAKAWTDTIDAAVDVALACGSETVILSTGRTSEVVAQKRLRMDKDLNEEAFVMMGDHVGYALRSCARKGVQRIIVAGQFAKLVKIACGHEQTHASSSDLDLQMLAEWLALDPRTAKLAPLAQRANSARQVLEASGNDHELIQLVCGKVRGCTEKLTGGSQIKVLLAGYGGEVLYFG